MKAIILVALSTISLAATALEEGVVIDLGTLGSNGFIVSQADPGDALGQRVSGAGDFNADGFADVIVGAYNAESPRFLSSDANAGEAYIIFGGPSDQDLNAGSLGDRGVTIFGGSGSGRLGNGVSGAGDVNGDGIDDVIIGASGEDGEAGAAYVFFGSPSPSNYDFGNFFAGNDYGFRIEGAAAGSNLGNSVSGAGDVNGDGLDDVIVGARYSDPGSVSNAGSAYVIFGKADNTPVDVSALSGQGFAMNGGTSGGLAGWSVSGAGDVNGDGLRDLIVGARRIDQEAGEAYVVYGKTDSNPVALEAMSGVEGFVIGNAMPGDQTGSSVAAAGDVNRDGFADVLVGAPEAQPMGLNRAGKAYLIFGRRGITGIDLGSLGSDGIAISGDLAGFETGAAVSGAGDLRGNGFASVLVGAPYRNAGAGTSSGTATAIYGNHLTADLLLSTGDSIGIMMAGTGIGSRFGWRVSGAGDINGDGRPDMVVGSVGASQAAVVFNPKERRGNAWYAVHVANGDPQEIPVGVIGDGSDEGFPAARAWLDFGVGGHLIDPGARVDVTLFRNSTAFGGSMADVSWQIETTRLFTELTVRFRYLGDELTTSNESAIGVFHSPDGNPPFTLLPGSVDPQRNEVTATTTQMGFFYLGDADALFQDRFEAQETPLLE